MTSSITSPNSEIQLTRGHKKKARTRQALIEAAIHIYSEKGVSELQLNGLAERAGVSNGTIYNYFKTRDEVLHAVGIELADQFSQRITHVSQGIENAVERVAVGIRMFILQGRSDPTWAGAVAGLFQHDQTIQSIVANNLLNDLVLGIKQGQFHIKNKLVAMGLIASATIGAISAILEGLDQADYDSSLAEMLLLALGVRAEQASQIANQALPEKKLEPGPESNVKRGRGRPRKTIGR